MGNIPSRRDVFRSGLAALLGLCGLVSQPRASRAGPRRRPPPLRAAPTTTGPGLGETTVFSYDAGGNVDLIPNDPQHCWGTTYVYDAGGPMSFNDRN